MATLSETLSKSKTPSYNYSYRLPSPYPMYQSFGGGGRGAAVSYPSYGGGQGIASSLFQQGQEQAARTPPSSQFQAQYDFDPTLARIQAMSTMSAANANAEAAALKKQALIDAGDPGIATEMGADPNTIEAARGNTFGTQQRLVHDQAERARQLDESENINNLYYSGHRVNQLGEQTRGFTEAQHDFGSTLRSILQQIETQRALRERQALLDAVQGAAGAAGGVSGAGGGGDGGLAPPSAPPPAPPPVYDPGPAGGDPGPGPYPFTGDIPPPTWAPPPPQETVVPPNAFAPAPTDISTMFLGAPVTQTVDPLIALALARNQRLGF